LNRLANNELRRAKSDIKKLGLQDVHIYHLEGEPNLGQLRNFSLDKAHGDILVQWDDDDLSHPERIASQVKILRKKSGVVYLQEAYHYIEPSGAFFWVNWKKNARANKFPAGIPQSIAFTKDIKIRYPESGSQSSRNEDTAFYQKLLKSGVKNILFQKTKYPLYTYVYHGGNVFDSLHHVSLGRVHSVSKSQLLKNKKIICQQIRGLNLDPDRIRLYYDSGSIKS